MLFAADSRESVDDRGHVRDGTAHVAIAVLVILAAADDILYRRDGGRGATGGGRGRGGGIRVHQGRVRPVGFVRCRYITYITVNYSTTTTTAVLLSL